MNQAITKMAPIQKEEGKKKKAESSVFVLFLTTFTKAGKWV